jgi:hypothetical protein
VTNRSLLTEYSNVDAEHGDVDPVEFCGQSALALCHLGFTGSPSWRMDCSSISEYFYQLPPFTCNSEISVLVKEDNKFMWLAGKN